jgi:hypothetical protein
MLIRTVLHDDDVVNGAEYGTAPRHDFFQLFSGQMRQVELDHASPFMRSIPCLSVVLLFRDNTAEKLPFACTNVNEAI